VTGVTRRPSVALVRHGETDWSKARRHTGRTDVPLTEAGRNQARLLGNMLAGWHNARVLTSPLRRAMQTCRLAGFSGTSEIVEDLTEWDYGEYEGRTTSDIRGEISDWSIWTHPVLEGESVDDVAERTDRLIAQLRDANRDVVVFAHGHLLRILAARWCGLPPDHGRFLALDPATLSVLGYEHETPVVQIWNAPCPPRAAE
jgi:broad specificity phosphatase PhoE